MRLGATLTLEGHCRGKEREGWEQESGLEEHHFGKVVIGFVWFVCIW